MFKAVEGIECIAGSFKTSTESGECDGAANEEGCGADGIWPKSYEGSPAGSVSSSSGTPPSSSLSSTWCWKSASAWLVDGLLLGRAASVSAADISWGVYGGEGPTLTVAEARAVKEGKRMFAGGWVEEGVLCPEGPELGMATWPTMRRPGTATSPGDEERVRQAGVGI